MQHHPETNFMYHGITILVIECLQNFHLQAPQKKFIVFHVFIFENNGKNNEKTEKKGEKKVLEVLKCIFF